MDGRKIYALQPVNGWAMIFTVSSVFSWAALLWEQGEKNLSITNPSANGVWQEISQAHLDGCFIQGNGNLLTTLLRQPHVPPSSLTFLSELSSLLCAAPIPSCYIIEWDLLSIPAVTVAQHAGLKHPFAFTECQVGTDPKDHLVQFSFFEALCWGSVVCPHWDLLHPGLQQ